jgi:hypothetical protein
MTHLEDDELVLRFYGEDDDAAAADAHLGACAECRHRFEVLCSEMTAIGQDDVPERPAGYEAAVWQRVEGRLQADAPKPGWLDRLRLSFSWPRLAFAGGLATVVVAAFFAGRYTRQPAAIPAQTTASVTSPSVVKERILLVAVGDHLERSRVVLAEIANGSAAETGALGPERAVAQDLVATNRLYRQTALESGDPAMASALEDLERVLVEIANSPETMSDQDLDRLRSRIASQGLIFKVTVLGSQVRQRQQDAAAAIVRGSRPKSST